MTSNSNIVNFHIVDIDINAVGKQLTVFAQRGSKLTGVSLDDISLDVRTVPTGTESEDPVHLAGLGMPLFDAIVWCAAPNKGKNALKADSELTEELIPSMSEIADAVFYVYFLLLTQARYPTEKKGTNEVFIPKFLKDVMGLKESQDVYMNRICSFNPGKFDAKWVRYVSIGGLGQEVMSRFGLGVAGYRNFGPFSLYPLKDGVAANIREAYEFAKSVATAPADWDVHPVTRAPSVLTKRGNLNANLANLMLECFTNEQLDEMVVNKIIYAKPIVQPRHTNYRTWSRNNDISGEAPIFPAQ